MTGNDDRQETGLWINSFAKKTHLPFRRGERAVQRLRRTRTLQRLFCIRQPAPAEMVIDYGAV